MKSPQPMNLLDFMADTCRAQAAAVRAESALFNMRRFTERTAAPVPAVEEQEQVAEQLRGGS